MSGQGKTGMSRTLVAGSEEDFDAICGLCDNEGQRVQATGHCLVCDENLCDSCKKFHMKTPALKEHVIQDKPILSHSKKAGNSVKMSAKPQDPLTDHCSKHPEELIKFYCKSHQTLGCSVCIPLHHRSCEDTVYIRDVSAGVGNSDEMKEIQAKIKMLGARLTRILSRTEWIKETFNDSCSQTISDIRNMKKEINQLLDQLEIEILEQISLMKEEKIVEIDNTISRCKDMFKETEEMITDMDKKKNLNHNNRLFISMKTAQGRINALVNQANNISDNNKCKRFFFQPNEKLTDLVSVLTAMGTVSLVSKSADVKATYQHVINCKFDTDREDCLITGMVILPNGRLALVDNCNKSIKIVNLTQCKVSEQMKIDSEPIDLTFITEDRIAVTLVGEKCVQVISVSPTLSKCQTIAVPGLYSGIEYIPNKLILLCVDPVEAVHICDMSGVLLQQIETDYGSNKLFTTPIRIAVSPYHGLLYVTDSDRSNITSLTTDGKLISKYTSDRLKVPWGVAVDDDGRVFVCSYQTHTIHQLSPSGQLVNILLEEKDGITFPYSIAHSAGYLYISSYSITPALKNNIRVYRLEQ